MEFEIKCVSCDEFEMEYLRFGHGSRTMVIIPGVSLKSVMLSAPAIAKQYEIFSDEYTVYLFDRKKNINRRYPVSEMADDTLKTIKILGLHDIYGLGISQGGMIFQLIALKDKKLIKKLVLGSTLSKTNPCADEAITTWIRLAEEREPEKLAHDMFDRIYSDDFLKRHKRALDLFACQITVEDCDNFRYLADACLGFNVYERLNEIEAELFVIGAKNDRTLSGRASVEIAEKTGCGIYMYDNYSHAVYDEAPDYRNRVIEFYNRGTDL